MGSVEREENGDNSLRRDLECLAFAVTAPIHSRTVKVSVGALNQWSSWVGAVGDIESV